MCVLGAEGRTGEAESTLVPQQALQCLQPHAGWVEKTFSCSALGEVGSQRDILTVNPGSLWLPLLQRERERAFSLNLW